MPKEPTARKPMLSARVHPDDRGRIEGLNAIATVLQGAPKQKAPISYYTPYSTMHLALY